MRDIDAGVTTLVRVSVTPTPAGVPVAGNRPSFSPFISADGRRVIYFSAATNLARLPDRNATPDVFFGRLAP